MIEAVTLENLRTKERLKLDVAGDGKIILDEAGIDWGTVSASIYTYKSPKQIGNEISGTDVESREVMIVGWLYGTQKDIERMQFYLGTFIVPGDEIKVYVKDYYIIGTPLNVIKFGTKVEQNNEYMCRFVISLYCNKPEFVRSTPNTINYSSTEPGFVFPFRFVQEGAGVIFGTVEIKTVQEVVNNGIHSEGGIITFKCLAESIRNPKIFNVYNPKEYILINKTLVYGEVITINTRMNEQDVIGELEGVKSDYFKYWSFNNTWLQFERGSSYYGITYEGVEHALEVQIEFNDKYYTIEGM